MKNTENAISPSLPIESVPMENPETARQLLTELFATQYQAVLATQQGEQPYTSLMAFVATPDLCRLLFATYRQTHKYANLHANPRAALLIDNRTAHLADHYQGVAVTATGQTREIAAEDHDRCLQLYVARHPNLASFIHSPDCALLELRVEHYYIVRQLHNVLDWAPTS